MSKVLLQMEGTEATVADNVTTYSREEVEQGIATIPTQLMGLRARFEQLESDYNDLKQHIVEATEQYNLFVALQEQFKKADEAKAAEEEGLQLEVEDQSTTE